MCVLAASPQSKPAFAGAAMTYRTQTNCTVRGIEYVFVKFTNKRRLLFENLF